MVGLNPWSIQQPNAEPRLCPEDQLLHVVQSSCPKTICSAHFVEDFVEPCGFRPFSTKRADKVHDKGPHMPFVGQALTKGEIWLNPWPAGCARDSSVQWGRQG
jgi:hypothetical protein